MDAHKTGMWLCVGMCVCMRNCVCVVSLAALYDYRARRHIYMNVLVCAASPTPLVKEWPRVVYIVVK